MNQSLAEKNMDGARTFALRSGRYLQTAADKEDMIASAYLGLVEAERSGKWDAERSSFYTFARWYMRSAFRQWTDLGKMLRGPKYNSAQMLQRTTTVSQEEWQMIETRVIDDGSSLEDAIDQYRRCQSAVLTLTIYREGPRRYWVGSDDIPGCFGAGGTVVAALESMTAAIRQHTAGTYALGIRKKKADAEATVPFLPES